MNTYHASAVTRNSIPPTERDLRAELALLQARYDGGVVSPTVYAIIRAIGTELSWLVHGRRW